MPPDTTTNQEHQPDAVPLHGAPDVRPDYPMLQDQSELPIYEPPSPIPSDIAGQEFTDQQDKATAARNALDRLHNATAPGLLSHPVEALSLKREAKEADSRAESAKQFYLTQLERMTRLCETKAFHHYAAARYDALWDTGFSTDHAFALEMRKLSRLEPNELAELLVDAKYRRDNYNFTEVISPEALLAFEAALVTTGPEASSGELMISNKGWDLGIQLEPVYNAVDRLGLVAIDRHQIKVPEDTDTEPTIVLQSPVSGLPGVTATLTLAYGVTAATFTLPSFAPHATISFERIDSAESYAEPENNHIA